MDLNDQEEQVRRVVSMCQGHWRSKGIPEDEVGTMGAELEEELRITVESGVTVEETVGPNVQEFAGRWAHEGDPSGSPRDRIVVGVIVVVLFLIFAGGIALRLVPFFDEWSAWCGSGETTPSRASTARSSMTSRRGYEDHTPTRSSCG